MFICAHCQFAVFCCFHPGVRGCCWTVGVEREETIDNLRFETTTFDVGAAMSKDTTLDYIWPPSGKTCHCFIWVACLGMRLCPFYSICMSLDILVSRCTWNTIPGTQQAVTPIYPPRTLSIIETVFGDNSGRYLFIMLRHKWLLHVSSYYYLPIFFILSYTIWDLQPF